MDSKKERILNCLKKNGEISQTKIAELTGLHYDSVKIFLIELEKEKEIQSRKSKFKTYTYWSLRK